MFKKRFLALVLVVLALMSMLSACASTPSAPSSDTDIPTDSTTADHPSDASSTPDEQPTDTGSPISFPLAEQKTFSAWVSNYDANPWTNLNDGPSFIELEKRTNVHVDYINPSGSAASEQFSLIIASGDFYDFMAKSGTATMPQLFESEVMWDLSEFLPTYAPNYYQLVTANEALNRDVTDSDGRYLAFYAFSEELSLTWWGLGMRKDILDANGLSLPETYGEWETALQCYKDNGVEIPLMLPTSGYFYNANFESGYGVSYTFYQDGDTVKYGPMEDGFKEYLSMMHDWMEKGYVSSSFVSDQQRFAGLPEFADVFGGVVGASIITSSEIADSYAEASGNPDFYYAAVKSPVKDDGSSRPWSTTGGSGLTNGAWLITTACDEEKVQLICSYLDYLYSDEGYMLYNWGVENDAFYYDENGEPQRSAKVDTTSYDNVNTFHVLSLTLYGLPGLMNDIERTLGRSEELIEQQAQWNTAGTGLGALPSLTFTPEEAEEYSSIANDCSTYVNENVAKFIMGERSLDEYDDFRDELRAFGIEDALEIYQAAFDRYYK